MVKAIKQKKLQTGSLHAVIIVVLFVALMATLGVVFYQNFIASKPKAVETTKTTDDVTVTKRFAFDSDIYSFQYPKEGWVSSESSTSAQSVSSIMTSKDGSVKAAFSISGDPYKDADCNVGDGLKVSYYTVDQEPIKGLADVPVYLVETIVDSVGGGYNYQIGLTPDSGATHASVGDNHCTVSDVGVASKSIIGINKLVKPTIIASITFPKIAMAKQTGAIKDMKQIRDVMNTDTYKAAVAMLKSARKE